MYGPGLNITYKSSSMAASMTSVMLAIPSHTY